MLVSIKRKDTRDSAAYTQYFTYNGDRNITVSALLDYLNLNDDLVDNDGHRCHPIDWECSCLQQLCGSCAMVINQMPALACGVFLRDLQGDTVTLEPLSVFPVIRDLRVDRSIIFEYLQQMELWITAFEPPKQTEQTFQYSSAKCLKCGLCMEVCPNYSGEGAFYGPVVLNETYLTYSQNADQTARKRMKEQFHRHFTASCSKALSCAKICPVNMQPLSSIALMNR